MQLPQIDNLLAILLFRRKQQSLASADAAAAAAKQVARLDACRWLAVAA